LTTLTGELIHPASPIGQLASPLLAKLPSSPELLEIGAVTHRSSERAAIEVLRPNSASETVEFPHGGGRTPLRLSKPPIKVPLGGSLESRNPSWVPPSLIPEKRVETSA
jgi:hypothetical protein